MSMQQNWSRGINTSPETEGSSEYEVGGNGGTERSRRSWTNREEATLILALKDLVATGWKSENGFRSGYQQRIEEAMKKEFPKTDLKVHPHIGSKIGTWKKNYYSLQMILERSGVGFNENGDYKIDCNDDQWAQIVKKDGNARYMRNKSWPYFEDWKVIYGKDRANGTTAKDNQECVNKGKGKQDNIDDDAGSAYYVNMDDIPGHDVLPEGILPDTEVDSLANGGKNTHKAAKSSGMKRKAEDPLEGVLHLMTQMHNDTNEHLKALSMRLGYEFDLNTKRTEVFELLRVIPGLTVKQTFYMCEKLVKEPELMVFFMALPEIARPAYAMYFLEKDGVE